VLPFPTHFAKGDRPSRFDFGERHDINRSQARGIYGREVYCVAKRQFSRRELRRFGLKNSVGPAGPLISWMRQMSRPAECF
jgi:hypothetical protein